MKLCTIVKNFCCIRYIICYCLLGITFLFYGCTSYQVEEVTNDLPMFSYLKNATSYMYIGDKEILALFSNTYDLELDNRLIKNIDSVSLSVMKDGMVGFIHIASKINLSTLSRRIRLMKYIKAEPIDETFINWRIKNKEKEYLVNISYANVLAITNIKDNNFFNKIQFVSELPLPVRMLRVDEGSTFWLWTDITLFKNMFDAQKVSNGYGAIAFAHYNQPKDVVVHLALPYKGSVSDFSTLKLMLPFLFKSLDANVFSSLPDVSFNNGVVLIRGLSFSMRIINSFLNYSLENYSFR